MKFKMRSDNIHILKTKYLYQLGATSKVWTTSKVQHNNITNTKEQSFTFDLLFCSNQYKTIRDLQRLIINIKGCLYRCKH